MLCVVFLTSWDFFHWLPVSLSGGGILQIKDAPQECLDQHNDEGYDKSGGTAFASWALVTVLLPYMGPAAGSCLTEVLVSSVVFSEQQH